MKKPENRKKRALVVRETPTPYAQTPRPAYDLEARTESFAHDVRRFLKLVPQTLANQEDGRQLIRASGSVGANYIEASEALGGKDFLFHVKISSKEAKESRYWLRLLDLDEKKEMEQTRQALAGEATELMNIFVAIYRRKS